MLRDPALCVKPPWSTLAPMVVSVFFSLLIFAVVVAFGRRSRPAPLKLDLELPRLAEMPARRTDAPELRIYIRVGQDASGAPQPRYIVQDKPARDRAELKAALERYAHMPGARGEFVVLLPDRKAPLGSIITALDCLIELQFRGIRLEQWDLAHRPAPPPD